MASWHSGQCGCCVMELADCALTDESIWGHCPFCRSTASLRPSSFIFILCISVTSICYSSLFLFCIQSLKSLSSAVCSCSMCLLSHNVCACTHACACVRVCVCVGALALVESESLFTWLTPGRLRHQAPARCAKLAILLRG